MFAVVRIRGPAGMKKEVEDTLRMLRLKAPNNCVLVPENDSYKGMLEKCKSACTWGEVERETVVELLKRRLRTREGKRVSEEELRKHGFSSFEELAEKLEKGDVKLKEHFHPVFRLRPPSKGFKSVKLLYPKGDLGYRGKEINELLKRMI